MIRHLTICFLFLTQTAFTQVKFSFSEYTVEDGLLDNTAYDVVQDNFGFIWLSHGYHLSCFDGYTFKIYENTPGDSLMQLDFIGELWDNSNGIMWIDNLDAEDSAKRTLSKYDRYQDGFIRYKPKLKNQPQGIGYFEQDKEQRIWMGSRQGGGLYEFNPDTGETIQYIHEHPDSLTQLEVNKITGIMDRDTVLYLTTYKGLWKFNKSTKEFRRPQINPKDTAILFNTFTHKYYSKNWISSGADGLWIKINDAFAIVDEFKVPPEIQPLINSYRIDHEDVFTFRTANGFYRYNYSTNALQSIREANVSGGGTSSLFTGWTVDRDGNLWITGNTIRKIVPPEFTYHVSPIKGFSEGVANLAMMTKTDGGDIAVIVAHNGQGNRIWTGPVKLDSVEFKLAHYNEYTRFEPWGEPDYVTKFETNRLGIQNPRGNGIFMSPHVGRNYLWVVAQRRGVVGIPYATNTGELSEKNVRLLYHDHRNPNTIPGASGFNVFEDLNDNLWLGNAFEPPTLINLKRPYGTEESVRTFISDPADSTSISPGRLLSVIQKDEKSVWVSTTGGLSVFQNGKFERVFIDSLGTYYPYLAPRGRLYVTTGSGIYTADANDGYRKFTKLINAFPWGNLLEDNTERLWMVTDRGLEVFDPRQRVTVRIWSKKEREIYSIRHTRNGKIFALVALGSLITFDPNEFTISQEKIIPVLTKLIVNHKSVRLRNQARESNDFSLSTNISVLDELVLGYKHNNFSIEFAALEMRSPNDNIYRHQLEGYDQDWIETDYKDRRANYTNLPSGNYLLRVKASNHHGVWSEFEKTLKVKILPPPWKTWWAYTCYSLLAIGLLFVARRMIVQRERLKANLDLAKVEQEKEHFELEKAKEVDQLKSRFFANISHEFRTPITLVLGPLRDLHKQISNAEQKNMIGSVIRNGQRLQRLINQLLDLSKVEAGKMKLHTSQVDLVELLREIVASYESLAREKNIRYFFYPEVKELMMYVDGEKMEKILHNLLSNAFKFTQEGGEIIVNLRTTEKNTLISVSDSGIGIPNDQLDKVFDRFYQVDSSQTRGYEGSGLGLALVKDLVEVHHGRISVDSKEGKGTTFTVSLPIGKEHLQREEIVESGVFERTELLPQDSISTNGVVIEKEATKENETALEHPVLLIVEDNGDMRQYIRKTLSTHYQIIEAENGREGVSKAEEVMPDLIISDIMMPVMDGYKLCSTIKSTELTSHIPVILLTAKADRESKLSGLEIGADDYLSKPFDADELKLIVRNRIEEKRKMREHFSKEITLEPKQIAITSLDEKFINKVLAMIESHMDDENFSIEDFSQEAGCSRMQFYRKIKGLTDQTPSQFVRSIRLKRAAQLLLAKSDNVSQIAYSVGFSSLAYFNKCFKEQFGITPGQYADANKTRV